MTSVLKPDQMGKPASKRLKKRNDSEGIQRVQKFDSLNAEHKAEINHSTSTPAELDEIGISPPQDTTLRMTTKRSDHNSTLLKDRGPSTLGVFQEPPEQTSFGAQNASLALEGLNDDIINARGFSRLSGLLDRPHLIHSAMMLTCQKQSTEQLKLLPLVKERLRSS